MRVVDKRDSTGTKGKAAGWGALFRPARLSLYPRPALFSSPRRPLSTCALALAVGQMLAALLYPFVLVCLGILLALAVLSVLCLALKRLRPFPALFLFVGFLLAFPALLAGTSPLPARYALLEGRVCEQLSVEDGQATYLLDNVSLNGERVQHKATLTGPARFAIGDLVRAQGEVSSHSFDPFDSYSMTFYHDDVRFALHAEGVKWGDGPRSVLDRVRVRLTRLYETVLGPERGGMAAALFLGDRSLLSSETSLTFRTSGVQHVFALSGLHVSFLCGLVLWLGKRLRLHRFVSFGVCFFVLGAYACLTGFPVSILRAIFCFAYYALAAVTCRRPDGLQALAFAYLLTQFLFPLSLFELGTQMSFCAVLGIHLFMPAARRALRRRPLAVRSVGSSVALSLSANAFLLPLMTLHFSSLGVYFLLGNLLVLPLISCAYSLLAPVSLLCLIWQGFGVLLLPVSWVLAPASFLTGRLAALPGATLAVGNATALAFVWAFTVSVQSPTLIMQPNTRVRATLTSLMLSVLLLAIS